jgi:hypothetical protein
MKEVLQMANRQLFLGFGAGLVFAAGFLSVFPLPEKTENNLTQEQLQAAAGAMQMVLLPKAEYDQLVEKDQQGEKTGQQPTAAKEPSQPQVKQAASAAPPNQPQVQQPAVQTQTAAVPQQPSAQAPAAAKTPEAQSPNAPQAETVEVSVRIPGGTTAAQAAKILEDAGILPEDNQFVELIREQKKVDRIRAGTYHIRKDISVEEVIKLLTTPPKE